MMIMMTTTTMMMMMMKLYLSIYVFEMLVPDQKRALRSDAIFCQLGRVSRKARKLFGPVKPAFLVQLYLKTEKCIHLKLLV